MSSKVLLLLSLFALFSHVQSLNPDRILCPVLASMYNAGSLQVDGIGRVQVWNLKEALMKGAGVNEILAEFQAVGVAAYSRTDINETHRDRCFEVLSQCWWEKVWTGNVSASSDRFLNIFTMNGHPNVEHGFSTGVRGGATNVPDDMCKGVFPCKARFDKFYRPFAVNGKFYRADLMKMVCFTMANGDRGGEFSYGSLVTTRKWQMHLAVNGWLTAFGRLDAAGKLYFTIGDVERMLMEGKAPVDWKLRNWGCLFTRKEGCTHPEDLAAMDIIASSLPCQENGWWQGSACETVVDETCTTAIGWCNVGNSTCIGTGGIKGMCVCEKGFCAKRDASGRLVCQKRDFKCQYFGRPCITW